MKENFAIDAINHIDNDLVEEYIKEKEILKMKKSHITKKPWIKWASIAACLALVLCIGIPTMLHLFPDDQGGKSPYPFDMLKVGESTTYEDGSVKFNSLNDTILTFTLTIYKEESDVNYKYRYDLEMSGYITNEDGTTQSVGESMDIEKLKITSNGQSVAKIPSTPGTYEISIDFSELVKGEGKTTVVDILMWGIAAFDIDYTEK